MLKNKKVREKMFKKFSCLNRVCCLLAVYLVLYYWNNIESFIRLVINAMMPIFIGCIIAYVVNILMSFYEQHYIFFEKNCVLKKYRRYICMLAAFITLFLILILVIGIVIPEFIACIQLFADKAPDVIKTYMDKVDESKILSQDMLEKIKSFDIANIVEELLGTAFSKMDGFMGTVVDVAYSIVSVVINFILGIIFAVYLLAGKERLSSQINTLMNCYLKEEIYKKIRCVWSVLNESFHRYIVGQCTEAVILGLLCTVGMWILRLPYATMIGALIALTALIPIAGAYIGAGVGAFMIFTVSPLKAIVFLIFIVILQQVEGNLIYPKVVGSSLGLPAIWVLAAVTIGGGVMGIPGMILGVPLAAYVYQIIKKDVKGFNHV